MALNKLLHRATNSNELKPIETEIELKTLKYKLWTKLPDILLFRVILEFGTFFTFFPNSYQHFLFIKFQFLYFKPKKKRLKKHQNPFQILDFSAKKPKKKNRFKNYKILPKKA